MSDETSASADDRRTDAEPYGAPPPEVVASLAHANELLTTLAAQGLRFRLDEHDGGVRVQLVAGEETVIRELPPRHALELLAGPTLP